MFAERVIVGQVDQYRIGANTIYSKSECSIRIYKKLELKICNLPRYTMRAMIRKTMVELIELLGKE